MHIYFYFILTAIIIIQFVHSMKQEAENEKLKQEAANRQLGEDHYRRHGGTHL